MGGWGRSVDISVVHRSVCVLYTEPNPDWDTIFSAHFFKWSIKSPVLPGKTEEGGVEHVEECLIFVEIVPTVCKGTSGSKAAFKRMNHLAPFFDHFDAHCFVQ